ncbi:MAG: hypothetical protein IIC21_07660 [Chloroflexi bacterium]|nr:hypothetical protein [Chloroflexota bacterium]
MLKRWKVLGKSAAIKTAIAITLVLSLVALPLPGSMGWAQGEAEAAPPAQEATPPEQLNGGWLAGDAFSFATSTRPGQKKRRGMAGGVASLATSTIPLLGDVTTLTIGSQFGDVQVLVTEETIIFSPFHTDLSAEDLGDYRLAIHFAKGENDDGTRTALRIMVIPDKAARTHSRGVIKAKSGGDEGEIEFEGDDGEIIALDGDAGDGDLEEGDDVIIVTQTVTDFDDDGDAEGHGRPKKIARGLQKASKIMKRLDRIMDRLTALGDSPAAEKMRARVEKFKARQLERFSDINARFSGDGSDSDDGSQNRGRNNRGRPLDVGATDFGPSDDGDDDGKQNRGRNRGRSADFSPQDSDGDDEGNRGRGRGRNSGKRGGNN